MSEIRWEGLTHDEIYATVHTGPGAAVSTPAEDAWKETEALILRIDERIASAMAASQASWEGNAADATRSAMTPLGQWALDAARSAKLTAGAVTGQGLQANYVRENMPEPVTEQRNAMIGDALTDPTYIFHGLDDLQAVEEDGANRAARAVELMNGYTDNSAVNRQFWVAAPFPPQVTVVTEVAAAGAAGPGAPGATGVPTPPADVAPPPPPGVPPVPPAVVPPVPPAGAPPAAPPTAQVPIAPAPPSLVPQAQPPRGDRPGAGPPAAPTVPAGPGREPPASITQPPVPPSGPRTGAPGGGPRPVVPRPAPPPSWRDVLPARPPAPGTRFPGPAGSVPDQPLPPGARPATPEPPGARPAGEPAARAGATGPPATTRPGAIGGLYPPLGAGMAGAQDRERRRPDYLLDDSDAFVDDRWFTPAVITPDDGPPARHRVPDAHPDR
ncbi:PPE domain-containing protein [Pseudonocardia sp. DLS-67]